MQKPSERRAGWSFWALQSHTRTISFSCTAAASELQIISAFGAAKDDNIKMQLTGNVVILFKGPIPTQFLADLLLILKVRRSSVRSLVLIKQTV